MVYETETIILSLNTALQIIPHELQFALTPPGD